MKLRKEFVLRALEPKSNFTALCAEFDISRKTGYKWKKAYKESGLKGLADHSRRPLTSPLRASAEATIEILQARDAHPRWGPKTLHEVLSRKLSKEDLPCERTIARVLKRAGRVAVRRRRCSAKSEPVLKPSVLFEQPNDLWTVDFKGWWRTKDEQRFEPLTVRDAVSRFLLCAQSLGSLKAEPVKAVFEALFEQYGLPKAILVDNGIPFISMNSLEGLTVLSAWWVSLGIKLVRTRPGKPQDNGGHERMHRTMAEDVEVFPGLNPMAQQDELDVWRHEFNHVRPHRALGMKVPAHIYRPSTIKYEPNYELVYDDAECVRKVSTVGRFRLNGKQFFLSHALRGQYVGLRRRQDGSYEVWFANHLLGIATEDSRKVLPISSEG
jgi:putative transposase